jgi:hypothetical protein|tara:strand:+ start:3657 stop:4271 length:615 start_codon:yes stop_codon:yes gene_type:complete
MQPEVLKLYGVKTMEQGLRDFAPHIYKKMNVAINRAAKEVQDDARSYIPAAAPNGLSNWMKMINPTAKTKQEMIFGVRTFPLYDAANMKKNIKIVKRAGKIKANGFAQVVQITNKSSAAASIFEKAGVVVLSPRPNRSRNPRAQYDFKQAMQNYDSISRGRGRAIIKAGRKDAGKTRVIIANVQRNADLELQKYFNQSNFGLAT